jgi:hypothetical protein
MSALEGRARPVLTPLIQVKTTRLEPHQLELICFGALKTSLMLDRCNDAQRQNVPVSEFREVYEKQSVLPSTHVWIGKCDVSRGSWFQSRTVELDTGDKQTTGYAATLCVGHVVFEVISIELSGRVKLGLKPDLLRLVAPIWPRNFKIDWPVTPAMTLSQVVSLGDQIAASGLRIYPD